MTNNLEQWKKRAAELLQKGHHGMTAPEASQAAASMLAALYGAASPQFNQFRASCDAILKSGWHHMVVQQELLDLAIGTLQSASDELDGGLVVGLKVTVTGEILAELVRVGKEVLDDRTEEAKNVGAVLVSAAYEGIVRRMGEDFACVLGRPKLEEVITSLKTAGVLKGGQVGIAQSYLKFRNDSLHADWSKVDRSQVESCLAFVEALLVKHFT